MVQFDRSFFAISIYVFLKDGIDVATRRHVAVIRPDRRERRDGGAFVVGRGEHDPKRRVFVGRDNLVIRGRDAGEGGEWQQAHNEERGCQGSQHTTHDGSSLRGMGG